MFPKSTLWISAALLAAACASPSGPAREDSDQAGGAGNLVLRELSLSGTVTKWAGKDGGGASNLDGAPETAVFRSPVQLAVDGGFLYVADQEGHAIRRVTLADGAVTTVAGGLNRTSGDVLGTGNAARFSWPTGLVVLKGHLYIADSDNQKVKKLNLATGEVSLVAGTKGTTASADGVGPAGHFRNPAGLTTDGSFLYVCDSVDALVRKIDPATGAVTTLVGTAAGLGGPRALSTDGRALYIADTSLYLIRRFDLKTKVLTTIAGSASGTSPTGPANQAGLGFCEGLWADGTNLYFSESTNNRVYKLDLAAATISEVAGSGSAFVYPAGLASDGTSLFVADYSGPVVRRID